MKNKALIIIVVVALAAVGAVFGTQRYRQYVDDQQYAEWLSVKNDADTYYNKFYKQRDNISVGFYNGEEVIKFDSHNEPYIDATVRMKYDPKSEDDMLENCLDMFKTYKAALQTSIEIYKSCNDRVRARIDNYQK